MKVLHAVFCLSSHDLLHVKKYHATFFLLCYSAPVRVVSLHIGTESEEDQDGSLDGIGFVCAPSVPRVFCRPKVAPPFCFRFCFLHPI